MMEARERFQRAGHYEPLKKRLREIVDSTVVRANGFRPVRVFDAGCGTGYYSEALEYGTLIGMDISRYAARRAAKLPRSAVFVADIWAELPLTDHSVDVILNVFAPHHFSEFRRITARGGIVVVVTPGPGHLEALRERGSLLRQGGSKLEALDAQAGMPLALRERLRFPLTLSPTEAVDAALMGPAGHHLAPEEIRERLGDDWEVLNADAVFDISVYSVEGGPAEPSGDRMDVHAGDKELRMT
jgi:23S rRNA (guanine745-N1)-methyltransferase